MPQRRTEQKKPRSRTQQVYIGSPVTWRNVLNPDQAALKELKELYPMLLEEDLQDCLPPFQRPKMLRRDGYLFLVLLFPVYDDRTRTILPYEVDFFVGKDFLVTSHNGTHPALTSLAEACNADTGTCTVRPGDTSLRLTLDIIHGLTVACYPMVTELSNELIGVERELFTDEGDGWITKKMLRIRTSVVGFRKATEGSDNVLRKLMEKGGAMFPIEEYRAQIEDITVHGREIREFLENDRDTIVALYDAHLAMVSYRATQATKTLTALAFIIFPMTLVAAVFSMRAEHMPIIGMRDDFWIILALIFSMMLVLLGLMRKKKWL